MLSINYATQVVGQYAGVKYCFDKKMRIISIRENTSYKDLAIKYFQKCWKSVWSIIYENCISDCRNARNDFPQRCLLEKEKNMIGCAG